MSNNIEITPTKDALTIELATREGSLTSPKPHKQFVLNKIEDDCEPMETPTEISFDFVSP